VGVGQSYEAAISIYLLLHPVGFHYYWEAMRGIVSPVYYYD
jgi:hypothetical protein